MSFEIAQLMQRRRLLLVRSVRYYLAVLLLVVIIVRISNAGLAAGFLPHHERLGGSFPPSLHSYNSLCRVLDKSSASAFGVLFRCLLARAWTLLVSRIRSLFTANRRFHSFSCAVRGLFSRGSTQVRFLFRPTFFLPSSLWRYQYFVLLIVHKWICCLLRTRWR